jgi:hypothetical protein
MICMKSFSYNPTIKTIETMPDHIGKKEFENIQAAFIQVEKEDEETETAVKK